MATCSHAHPGCGVPDSWLVDGFVLASALLLVEIFAREWRPDGKHGLRVLARRRDCLDQVLGPPLAAEQDAQQRPVLGEEAEELLRRVSDVLEPTPFDAPELTRLVGPDTTELRLLPLAHGTDGYFVASLRRRELYWRSWHPFCCAAH